MIEIEIKIWLTLLWIILIVPVFFVFKNFIWIFISQIKNFYNKIEFKKNLEKIKEDIIERNKQQVYQEESWKKEVENEEKSTDLERYRKRIEGIKHTAIALKEKWELKKYEKKLIEWLSYDPWNYELTKMLGELYFNTWYYKKALPLLKKIIEQYPEDHKSIWQIWQIYFEKSDFETAKLLIEKAIEIKPNNPKYLVSMAEISYNTENIQDAINYMIKAVEQRPHNINYLLALAALYEEIEDYQQAKKYYFKILEVEPTNETAKSKIQEI